MRPSCEAAGFTLVETVLVAACALLLAAAAIPNLDRIRRDWVLHASANLMAHSLSWGRMHAITTNSEMLLHVDIAERRICWAEPESGECYRETIRDLPAEVRLAAVPRRPVRFHPRGNAAPGGSFVLEGSSAVYRVIVSPAGRIRIERTPR